MKFMIHSCNSRKWYVDEFLVPSMIKQGISKEDIYVYNDDNNEGNLKSWIKSCHLAYEMWGSCYVWHLQDDVVIASYFKQQVEKLESNNLNIICGFVCKYNEGRGPGGGIVATKMWYSFPCLRLSTNLTKQFAVWADATIWNDFEFGYWVRQKKGDDLVFRVFLEENYPDEPVWNLSPNLVDHIDYLIGGTTVNNQRKDNNTRSIFWVDNYIVDELAKELKKRQISD